MAAFVAQGQLTATPSPIRSGWPAPLASSRRSAPSLHVGSLAAAQDFYGIARATRDSTDAVTTPPARSSGRHPSPRGRSTWTRSPPNCSRWSNSPSNQSGCRSGCARPASHRRYRKQLQLPLRRQDNVRVSVVTDQRHCPISTASELSHLPNSRSQVRVLPGEPERPSPQTRRVRRVLSRGPSLSPQALHSARRPE